MSYSFSIHKVDGELVLKNHEYAALPDGAVLTVNGHEPVEGTSPVGTLGIALSVAREDLHGTQMRVSAMASYHARPTPAPLPSYDPEPVAAATATQEG